MKYNLQRAELPHIEDEMNARFKVVKSIFLEDKLTKEILTNRTYIAGGAIRSAIRGEIINDVDVFFYDDDSLNTFVNHVFELIENNKIDNSWNVIQTENALSFEHSKNLYPNVQFIKLHTAMPSQMIGEFDFTFNMNYFIPSSYYLYVEDLEAIEEKKLKVNISNCSIINTFFRMMRFMNQGWLISGYTLSDMAILLSRVEEMSSREEVQKHLLMGLSQTDFDMENMK